MHAGDLRPSPWCSVAFHCWAGIFVLAAYSDLNCLRRGGLMARFKSRLLKSWISKSCRRTSVNQRLRLLPLEAREMPALFTVTNLGDLGGGSLRQAIIGANGSPGQDTINFQSGLTGTIPLDTTLS